MLQDGARCATPLAPAPPARRARAVPRSREARVILASTAASGAPRVIAGRTRCASVPRPDTGSQPRPMEKTIASSGPSQKLGIEIPEQRQRRRRMIDAGAGAHRRDDPERHRNQDGDAHRRERQLEGGRQPRRNGADHRLPGAQRRAQISDDGALEEGRRTARSSGRSRPRRWRSSITSSGAALSPRMACAGSPGTRWMSENTSVATPNSTGSVKTRRRSRNRVTGARS